MKKTAIALSLIAAGFIAPTVNAATISQLQVTSGDFAMNSAPDGTNAWSGNLDMGTAGVQIADAFNFNGIFGLVDLGTDGLGLSGNDDSGVHLDLGNFAIDWNNNHIGQGAPASRVTTTGGAGVFTAAWSSLIVRGSFDGNIGNWTMEGTYSTVPVPAAVWLFGSGLLGLVGIARRRKVA